MEQKAHTPPDWDKVRRMIERYGSHWDYNSEDCNYTNSTLAKEAALKRFDEWEEQAKTVNEAV
jgi:phage-related protein